MTTPKKPRFKMSEGWIGERRYYLYADSPSKRGEVLKMFRELDKLPMKGRWEALQREAGRLGFELTQHEGPEDRRPSLRGIKGGKKGRA